MQAFQLRHVSSDREEIYHWLINKNASGKYLTPNIEREFRKSECDKIREFDKLYSLLIKFN